MNGRMNYSDKGALPLSNAVFCLDCELITNSRGDECPGCKGRSCVSLARLLGGTLPVHRAQRLQKDEGGMFDVTITVALQQMCAPELSSAVEKLTGVLGPFLAREQATLHVGVSPTFDQPHLQRSLHFPERNAA